MTFPQDMERRMKRILCIVLWVLGMAMAVQAEPIALKRGVNVHEWLNWSPVTSGGSYVWPPYRSYNAWLSDGRPLTDWPAGDQFVRIKAMGFDFVRLTIDPGPLLANTGARRQQALDILEAAVRRITAADLKVVFNLHLVSQVPAYSESIIAGGAGSAGVTLYRGMVVDVANMLVDVGVDKVALEPFNEPAYYPCDATGSSDWQTIMATTVANIRAVSTQLTVIATGACGGSITGLTDLDPSFDDANLLYSFHMYEPHSFTHQRPEAPATFYSGLPWPVGGSTPADWIYWAQVNMSAAGLSATEQQMNLDEANPRITEYFSQDWGLSQLVTRVQEATYWAAMNNIPNRRLFMGEFGAILMPPDYHMGTYEADRSNYVRAVRVLAENFGINWSIWEYSSPTGMSVIQPIGPAVPDADLLTALGL